LKTTVCLSGAVTVSIMLRLFLLTFSGVLMNRLYVATTSSASIARPLTGGMSWKKTLGRSLNVQVVRSGDSTLWATSGSVSY